MGLTWIEYGSPQPARSCLHLPQPQLRAAFDWAALLNGGQGFTSFLGTQGRRVLSCRTTDGLVMPSDLAHALATFTTMKG